MVLLQVVQVAQGSPMAGWYVPALQVTHDGVDVCVQKPESVAPSGQVRVHGVHTRSVVAVHGAVR